MKRESALYGWFAERLDQVEDPGPWLEITQEMINRFANLTGDHQWIHLDVERAARESPFGTTVAHGYLVLSLIFRLLSFPPPGAPMGSALNYGLDRLRFTAPVRAGARIRGQRTIKSVDRLPGGGVKAVFATTIEVEGEQKPACVFDAIVLAYP